METIILLIGGFFLITWTISIFLRPEFMTFNGRIVYVWWALFASIFFTANSFLHLAWAMPLVAILTLIGVSAFGGGLLALLFGSIPIFIIFWL